MGLSERMAAARVKKEQHIAERQTRKIADTGEAIVKSLESNRSRVNLNNLELVAEAFAEAQSNNTIEKLLDNAKHKIMYGMVKEYLEGDWMSEFRKLLSVVPADRRLMGQAITWQDWQKYAVKAGLEERELVQALRVIMIFRDALDRNGLKAA